jgi:hypothetical protein
MHERDREQYPTAIAELGADQLATVQGGVGLRVIKLGVRIGEAAWPMVKDLGRSAWESLSETRAGQWFAKRPCVSKSMFAGAAVSSLSGIGISSATGSDRLGASSMPLTGLATNLAVNELCHAQ